MAIGERWRKFWQSDSTRTAVEFEHWNEHVTQDDIRVLFLRTLKEGNNVLVPAITSTELEHFKTTPGSFDVAADGQIQMASIIRFLAQAHGSRADLITSVAPTIEALIASHAHFPFSAPVGMSNDALCRTIILLTNRCQEQFRQVEGYNSKGVSWEKIRKRPDERRLAFIHSALMRSPTGVPTHEDILDVVCRVDYPCVKQKGRVSGRPVTDFLPLAKRLEPLGDAKDPGVISVSQLQPLRDIVAAFPPRSSAPAADLDVSVQDTLSAEQFVEWALEVQLLGSFDQLFWRFPLSGVTFSLTGVQTIGGNTQGRAARRTQADNVYALME